MTDDEMIESGRTCPEGHPIWMVAEGYGICQLNNAFSRWDKWWTPWRLTPEDMVCLPFAGSKEEVLACIQDDMVAYRELPYDEDRERARLVAV